MAQEPQTHALYRFFGAGGTLLYIGITNSLPRRLRQHNDDKAWWLGVTNVTIEHYPDRDAVLEAERRAIIAEKPLYNDKHNQAGRWVAEPPPAAPSSGLTPICQECRLPIPPGDGTLHLVMADAMDTLRSQQAYAVERQHQDWEMWRFLSVADPIARWQVHCDDCNPHVEYSPETGYDPCGGCYSIGLDNCRTWARLTYWTWHLSGKSWFGATNWNAMLGSIATGQEDALFVADDRAVGS